MNKKTVAIFGAGITGLAAARELTRKGYSVNVYEASDHVGGLATTFKDPDGFTYDNGPRFIFSTLAEKIGIANDCEPVSYYEYMHVGDKTYRFPFGFIKNPFYCMSIGWAMLTRSLRSKPQNLQEFLRIYYGKGFSGKVLQPLIEKWSGIPAKEVSLDFASRLLPTNLSYIFYSIIKKLRGGVTEDYFKKERYIVYPKGSNSMIFDALQREGGYKIHLNSPISEMLADNGKIVSAKTNGLQIQADYFISTMPISKLSSLLATNISMQAWKNFEYRTIRILFIKINQDRLIDGLWHWFPESQYPFYRVSEYKNARKNLAPEGKTLISLELGLSKNDRLLHLSDQQLFEEVFPQLHQLYGLKKENILGLRSHVSEAAYPILKKQTETIQRALDTKTPYQNLFIAGRTGMFQYKMTEGSYDSAIECVETLDAIAKNTSTARTSKNFYDFSDSYGRPNQIPE